jgi:hypothetical protein
LLLGCWLLSMYMWRPAHGLHCGDLLPYI